MASTITPDRVAEPIRVTGISDYSNELHTLVGDLQQAAEAYVDSGGSIYARVFRSITILQEYALPLIADAAKTYQENSSLASESEEADTIAGRCIVAFGRMSDKLRIEIGNIYAALPDGAQILANRQEALEFIAENRDVYRDKLANHILWERKSNQNMLSRALSSLVSRF